EKSFSPCSVPVICALIGVAGACGTPGRAASFRASARSKTGGACGRGGAPGKWDATLGGGGGGALPPLRGAPGRGRSTAAARGGGVVGRPRTLACASDHSTVKACPASSAMFSGPVNSAIARLG